MSLSPAITPLEVPAGIEAVVVMGGSFDPVHLGHVEFAILARQQVQAWGRGPVWVVFVPASRSPFKVHPPGASDADRVQMLRLAIREVPDASVWSDELDRAGEASYTIDTLRRARQLLDRGGNASTRVYLLVGADQAAGFHRWREAREILKLAQPLVVGRDHLDVAALLAPHWDEAELRVWEAGMVRAPEREVSSTSARAALRAGDDAKLAALLDPSVASYALERGLYR